MQRTLRPLILAVSQDNELRLCASARAPESLRLVRDVLEVLMTMHCLYLCLGHCCMSATWKDCELRIHLFH